MARREQSEAGAGGWFSLHQSHVWARRASFLGTPPKMLLAVSGSVKDLLGFPLCFLFLNGIWLGQVTSLPFLQAPLSLLPSRGDTGAGLGRQRCILYKGA